MSNDIEVTARELDFVTRFNNNWEHLRDILGIMRPIKKQPGAVLKSKTATVTLEDSVGEGYEIPYSAAAVTETPYTEMDVEKYAKAVSIEAIKDHGYEVAVGMTDDAFLYELQDLVTSRFYEYLNTGALTSSEASWQMALAMAKGYVLNKFKAMHKTVTEVVGFANVLDLYSYLGAADITIQNYFGLQYVQNFMGYRVLFLLSDSEIARGRVIATPVENINLYYVDPGDSDFARAGLNYTTAGDTSLIGFHTQGNYNTAVSESFAILGMVLFAEYLDGIAVIDVDDSPTLGELTVTSEAGTEEGDTKLTVSEELESENNHYKWKADASTAPTVTYGQNVRTWHNWDGESDLTITDGYKVTVVECDGMYKALNAGSATVVANDGT